MRDFLMSYDYLQSFIQWLNQRHISCPVLESITKDEYALLSYLMKVEDVDHILHIPFSVEMETIAQTYEKAIHIVYVPGFDENNLKMTSFPTYENIYFYAISTHFQKDNLSFFDPFPAFFCALNHVDSWPGCLIFQEQKMVFVPIKRIEDFTQLKKAIEQQLPLFDIYQHYQNDAYFIQLSDLHLGKNKRQKGLARLYASLDELMPRLPSLWPVNILITGDLMESPNRKNMYAASHFMNRLKRKYHSDVTFVLGNHDVIVYGLNLLKKQKTKVVAYLLGENIKVYPDVKMIVIKIDSTSQGNLARGMVGQRLLQEIEDELLSINHLEDYTLIAMMHHHLMPLRKDDFLKIKWNEKLFMGKIADSTKALVDAQDVMYWLEKHHVRYIFHGHKHIPCVVKKGNTYIMAGGSSCGGGTRERKSSYLSYNLLKYNRKDQAFKYCFVFYDDLTKQERHRVKIKLFMEDQNEVSR